MSIQDLKYLKQNSRENSLKVYFSLDNLFNKKKKLKDLISNVFTIHILDVYLDISPSTKYILSIYANDNKMDSIALNQQINLNVTGREYEHIMINPLAKVSELTFKLTDFDNTIIENSNIEDSNVCILIRNYEPKTEFNDNYNELNPQYNPHITIEDSDEEDYDEED